MSLFETLYVANIKTTRHILILDSDNAGSYIERYTMLAAPGVCSSRLCNPCSH